LTPFEIISLIGTFLIVYFTWKTAKLKTVETRETLPNIAAVEHRGQNVFYIVITNNKSHSITLEDMFVKRKLFPFIYSGRLPIKWSPKTTGLTIDHDRASVRRMVSQLHRTPQYVIKDQYELHVTIPLYREESTYKFFVKTSGGLCQSTYHSQSEHQVEGSEPEENKQQKSNQ